MDDNIQLMPMTPPTGQIFHLKYVLPHFELTIFEPIYRRRTNITSIDKFMNGVDINIKYRGCFSDLIRQKTFAFEENFTIIDAYREFKNHLNYIKVLYG